MRLRTLSFSDQPAEYGPVLPVSRAWNFVGQPASADWNYVIFDWDNIFASYMTSLDPASKAIAYSNFIQVIKSKTVNGFVPNFAAGGVVKSGVRVSLRCAESFNSMTRHSKSGIRKQYSCSEDRTEPPIGCELAHVPAVPGDCRPPICFK